MFCTKIKQHETQIQSRKEDILGSYFGTSPSYENSKFLRPADLCTKSPQKRSNTFARPALQRIFDRAVSTSDLDQTEEPTKGRRGFLCVNSKLSEDVSSSIKPIRSANAVMQHPTFKRSISLAAPIQFCESFDIQSHSRNQSLLSMQATANSQKDHQAGEISPSTQIQQTPCQGISPLPGFGCFEADGKLLPCHKVKADGLMRITAKTLSSYLDGTIEDSISNQISEMVIIDCRQSYEYRGGHIKGAINLSHPKAVEDFLFGQRFSHLRATTSADTTQKGKTIVIMHCEFSEKRGPTL